MMDTKNFTKQAHIAPLQVALLTLGSAPLLWGLIMAADGRAYSWKTYAYTQSIGHKKGK